jgi:hypothetical protein
MPASSLNTLSLVQLIEKEIEHTENREEEEDFTCFQNENKKSVQRLNSNFTQELRGLFPCEF